MTAAGKVGVLRRLPLLLALLLPVLTPGRPASAHTALKETSPAAGASVPSPEKVVLTFADSVIFPSVTVTDARGRPRQSGQANVRDNVVTVRIAGTLPGGSYRVAWRAVSPDGHPISGRYAFTVAGGTAGAPSTAAAPDVERISTDRGDWWRLGLILTALAAPAAAFVAFRRSRSRSRRSPES